MRCGFWSGAKRGLRAEQGAVAVEFAIILPVLMLLAFGIVDFGHYWYMSHVMSDASREGARYGTRFTGKLPGDLSPSITTHVLSLIPPAFSPTVNLSGPGTTAALADLAGKDLVVEVNATKTWWVLGSLIPGFGPSKLLTIKTTMTCE